MPGQLQIAGAKEVKETRYSCLFTNRMFTGLWTQRNPLRDPSPLAFERWYGGRPDALITGLNVELTNRLTLARRPGHSAYSVATFTEAVNSFYSFKQFSANTQTITVIADTPNHIYTLTPATKTSIYTKSSSSNSFGSSYLGLGNTLYIGNANSADQPKAWEGGSNTVRNWGISQAGTGGSSSLNAGTGTQGSTVSSSSSQEYGASVGANSAVGGQPWDSPNGAASGTFPPASVTMAPPPEAGNTSDFLITTGYGFSIPASATINGVVVDIQRSASQDDSGGTGAPPVTDTVVTLSQSGASVGTNHADTTTAWPTTAYSDAVYGNASDLWGLALTPAAINASDFGVAIQIQNNIATDSNTGVVYFVFIQVYYTVSVAWTSPTNIVGAPAHGSPNYATVTPQTGLNSPNLNATNYGFAVANTVVGITVAIYGHVSSSSGSPQLTVQLRDNNGNAVGAAKVIAFTNTGDATVTLGASGDTWNASLNPTIVNGASFGAIIVASGTAPTFSLNACTITVYTSAAPGVTPSGGGAFTGTYLYAYSYANSNVVDIRGNPVVSNIVGGTATATPSANAKVTVAVIASSDAQVNQIILWRSKASGSTLFYLGAYANSTGNIDDNATADTALDTTKLAATAFQLTPPPQNLYGPVYHAGRVWGFVNNVVYYATGPDIGNIYGSGSEGFPPANYFTFPNNVTKLVATASGLLVFTVEDVWIITGNASATGLTQVTNTTGLTLFNPYPVIADFGLVSPHALDVNGATIYLFTSDLQFLSIDVGAGVSEIGFPIGAASLAYPNDSTLASFDPSSAYVAWHVTGSREKAIYVSDGSTGWFRCNPALPPDGGAVWSPKATIAAGCMAVQTVETTVGVHNLLIGPGSGGGAVLYRNPNVFTDNGSAYASNFTMGSIGLVDPGQIAQIGFLSGDFARTGTSPVVSVLLNEISGTFQSISGYVHGDPPAIYGASGSPSTLYSNRYDMIQNVYANSSLQPSPALCRHMQLKVDFGSTDTVQNEMLGIGIYGTLYQEQ